MTIYKVYREDNEGEFNSNCVGRYKTKVGAMKKAKFLAGPDYSFTQNRDLKTLSYIGKHVTATVSW